MTFKERILHTVLFELFAVLSTVLFFAQTTSHSSEKLSFTIIGISVVAMLWNMLFNWIFDQFFHGAREKRSLKLRIIHTLIFEIGLLVFSLPWIAYQLNIGWLEALIMDLATTIFIVFYTLIFNWCYDQLRAIIINRRH
ncbi:MAG: PACE efflux transporter [Pasteurellaceae bacterium]|nr:PACE efflux transporter [Pasteurellaceae bacterium]